MRPVTPPPPYSEATPFLSWVVPHEAAPPSHREAALALSGRYSANVSAAEAGGQASEEVQGWCSSLRGFFSTACSRLTTFGNSFTMMQAMTTASVVSVGGLCFAAGGLTGIAAVSSAAAVTAGALVCQPRPLRSFACWSQAENGTRFQLINWEKEVVAAVDVQVPGGSMAMLQTTENVEFVRVTSSDTTKDSSWTPKSGGCFIAYRDQIDGSLETRLERSDVSADRCLEEAVNNLRRAGNLTIRAVNDNPNGDMTAACWDASGNKVEGDSGLQSEFVFPAANGPFRCQTRETDTRGWRVGNKKVDVRDLADYGSNDYFACLRSTTNYTLLEGRYTDTQSRCAPTPRAMGTTENPFGYTTGSPESTADTDTTSQYAEGSTEY